MPQRPWIFTLPSLETAFPATASSSAGGPLWLRSDDTTHPTRRPGQIAPHVRAVIAKPRLLLADEPTGNLPGEQGLAIMRLFNRLNDQGTTIVQVPRSGSNAAYGKRIIRLYDGWMEKQEHDTAVPNNGPRPSTFDLRPETRDPRPRPHQDMDTLA